MKFISSGHRVLSSPSAKGLFTRREGYPSKRVNPSRRVKDSPGLQAKYHRQLGNPTTRDKINALGNTYCKHCLVNTTKKKKRKCVSARVTRLLG